MQSKVGFEIYGQTTDLEYEIIKNLELLEDKVYVLSQKMYVIEELLKDIVEQHNN